MQSIPGRFGVASASIVIAMVLACNSAPSQPPIETTGTNDPSTGGGGGSSVDSGGAEDAGSCAPSLGEFTPIPHTAARTAGACTAAQLSAVYDACFASGSSPSTCATSWTTVATNATCNSCLLANSDPTGSAWGPIVQYGVSVQLNVGGCVALDVPSEEAGDCARASEALAECINAACDTTCSGSGAAFASCQAAAQADATACSYYLAGYQSACATLSSSVCFSGAGGETTFAAITGVFCE